MDVTLSSLLGFVVAAGVVWAIHRIVHVPMRSEKKTFLALEVAALTLLFAAFLLLELLEILGKTTDHVGLRGAFIYVFGSLVTSFFIYKGATKKAQ